MNRRVALCSWSKLSLRVRLGLLAGFSGCAANSLLAFPVEAQTVEESVEPRTEIGSNVILATDNLAGQTELQGGDLSVAPASVPAAPAMPQLSELEQAATTVEDWVAQIEASLVQITNVRVEATEAGLQVVLETENGVLEVLETRSVGNALVADIPNAAIAEEFSQANPIEGIALVSVSQLPGDTVRVAITGTDAPPVAEVTSEAQGLVLAVTLGDADAVAEEDAIQVVVTGEQDEGYNPSSTSIGTRTDTPLRDIPQSIQIVPQEVLRDQNITRLDEAIRNVPGANQSTTPSIANNIGSFISRGFDVSSFNSGSALRNGFRDSIGDYINDLTNVERIEFLRGPASVFYGVGSAGGRINLVTRQPLREPFYAIDATIGNYDFYRGAIDLSGPLNNSRTVLYRFNASYLDRNSFLDFYEQRSFAVAPTLSFALGERTLLTLEGEYYDRRATPNTPGFGLPALGTVLPNPNGEIPRDRFLGEPEDFDDRSVGRVGYRLEHQFSDNWSLRSAFGAGFANFSRDDVSGNTLDADNRTLQRGRISFRSPASTYSLTAEVIGKFSTGSINHQLVFGTALSRFEASFQFGFEPFAPIDLFDPVYRQQPREPLPITSDTRLLTDTLGIYLQDQVTLTENLRLVLGGQFDLFEQTDSDFLADTETSQSGDAFSPFVGIVYQPVEPISLYASYARSFTPTIGRAFDGGIFQPERGTQYEVGIKADVNESLSTTLALYNLTRTNVLTPDTRPGVPPGEFSIQTGEQRSRGVELSLQGEILPGWNIIAGYAYTDAEVTEDNTIPEGNQLNLVPENSFNLWTTYEIQRGALQGLGFGLGLFFVGERQGDLANSFQLPSYLRTDAAIYYQRDRLRAALNLKNLFDIDYFETAEGNLSVFYGEPFTVQGTISYEF